MIKYHIKMVNNKQGTLSVLSYTVLYTSVFSTFYY